MTRKIVGRSKGFICQLFIFLPSPTSHRPSVLPFPSCPACTTMTGFPYPHYQSLRRRKFFFSLVVTSLTGFPPDNLLFAREFKITIERSSRRVALIKTSDNSYSPLCTPVAGAISYPRNGTPYVLNVYLR